MKKRTVLFIGFVIIVYSLSLFLTPQKKATDIFPTPFPTVTPKAITAAVFGYPGNESIDALTLLQQKAKVTQDASGMVDSINGRKADPRKKEYWAFYVNGKLSQVGPKDYITKHTDMIDWKLETY